MKTDKEIAKEAWNDWKVHYSKIVDYDNSNSGDVEEWGRREYLRDLLDVYSCHVCRKWFPTENGLCDCLKTHGYEIVERDYSGYSDLSKTYFKYVSQSSNQTANEEVR